MKISVLVALSALLSGCLFDIGFMQLDSLASAASSCEPGDKCVSVSADCLCKPYFVVESREEEVQDSAKNYCAQKVRPSTCPDYNACSNCILDCHEGKCALHPVDASSQLDGGSEG